LHGLIQNTEVRMQEPEDWNQKTGARMQKSEYRSKKGDSHLILLTPDS